MFPTSLISTINVLRPLPRSSLAPTRVNTLSMIGIDALFAGTNEPMCAKMVISATCFMYTLLPAILGPVINMMLPSSSRDVSFGTKSSPLRSFSTIGCRPSIIFKQWISLPDRLFGCGEHFCFEFFEFFRYVTFGVDGRLLADVSIGNE